MVRQARKVGRPRKTPEPANRISLGLKVTAETKLLIDEAAKASGRTQSQEAEYRIQKSFDNQGLLHEVLELQFGRELAGVLLILGRTMNDTGQAAGFMERANAEYARNWLQTPFAFDQAFRAVTTTLNAFRPNGDASPRSEYIDLEDSSPGPLGMTMSDHLASLGNGFASGVIAALLGRGSTQDAAEWAESVRELLGPITDQLKHPNQEEK